MFIKSIPDLVDYTAFSKKDIYSLEDILEI